MFYYLFFFKISIKIIIYILFINTKMFIKIKFEILF